MTPQSNDIWSQWIFKRRYGNDPQRVQAFVDILRPIRDKVLDHAQLHENDLLLDVGCGDGLIAFGALERVPTCRVIFSDVSQDLLTYAHTIAEQTNVLPRCQFLHTSADQLTALTDESVDIVTTRSVLIYIADKQRALHEFYRVLKPHGRLSLFEPINRFSAPAPDDRFTWYDVRPVQHLAAKVKRVFEQYQPLDRDPMLNFDERDLLTFMEKVGFREIHLELQVEIKPHTDEVSWETWMHTAWNPKRPTFAEAVQQALTPAEAQEFIAYLRPLVESKQGILRSAVAYLWAIK